MIRFDRTLLSAEYVEGWVRPACTLSIFADTIEMPASKRKQGVDEALDRFRHAVGDQRLPDQSALGGEMRGVGQRNACGDLSGAERRRGKILVQRVGGVELGNRQRPDQIVEVPWVALSDRLTNKRPCRRLHRRLRASTRLAVFRKQGRLCEWAT